jgi:hypothetical protein
MDYKIVNFYPKEGKIEVFFSNKLANHLIDLPINDDGLFITGQELDTYIKGFIPTWHLERMEKLKVGIINANEIATLVEAMPYSQEEVTLTEEARLNAEMWKQLEEEKTIARVLVKFGVLTENPTVISNTTL